MADIQYMLKPDWVSWSEIKECMYQAHAVNRKKGIVMQNQFMSEAEFEEYYKGAYCFVALEDNHVIGTGSVRFQERHSWWAKGRVAYSFGDSILPAYRGTDIIANLNALRDQLVKKEDVKILFFDTAENNMLVQKLNLKMGARRVQLYASRKTWYYSVVMAFWLDGQCPYSKRYCDFRYSLSKFLVKLIWKPGRKIRFWFH